MKRIVLLLIVLMFGHPKHSCAQAPVRIQNVKLGNIKKSVTHYGKYPYSDAQVTYGEILANTKLICDVAGYSVSHYKITIIPPGRDLIGPTPVSGGELPTPDVELIKKSRDAKEKIKIAIEEIQLTHNGKEEPLTGTLIYECK